MPLEHAVPHLVKFRNTNLITKKIIKNIQKLSLILLGLQQIVL